MASLRVALADFWPGHGIDTDPILAYLQKQYRVNLVSLDNDPDLIYCSVFGSDHRRSDAKKLLYSGENYLRRGGNGAYIDLEAFDWVFLSNTAESIDIPSSTHHVHVPWLMYEHDPAKILQLWQDRRANDFWSDHIQAKKNFSCFIVSNGVIGDACKGRDQIFHGLSTYKWVDSAGFHLNNMEGRRAPQQGFIDWIGKYRYIICSENSLASGYFTEKLSQSYRAGTIPIYYCHQDNLRWWNPDSMVFHTSVEDTIKQVVHLDADPIAYTAMLTACPFRDEQIPRVLCWDRIYRELDEIVNQLRS